MADKSLRDENEESLSDKMEDALEGAMGKKKEGSLRDRMEDAMDKATAASSRARRAQEETEDEAWKEKVRQRAQEDEYLDTYTVQKGDTLSGIALRYYNSPARDKWMAIYEANKEVIGDNPGMIYPGQEFKIPRLEEDED